MKYLPYREFTSYEGERKNTSLSIKGTLEKGADSRSEASDYAGSRTDFLHTTEAGEEVMRLIA